VSVATVEFPASIASWHLCGALLHGANGMVRVV
jgi:hypothetical protein